MNISERNKTKWTICFQKKKDLTVFTYVKFDRCKARKKKHSFQRKGFGVSVKDCARKNKITTEGSVCLSETTCGQV